MSVGGNATKANNTKQLSKLLKDMNLKRNVSNFLSNPSSTIHRDGSEQTKHKKSQSQTSLEPIKGNPLAKKRRSQL